MFKRIGGSSNNVPIIRGDIIYTFCRNCS